MKKLKLPVIREELPPPRSLSMDEYVEFVLFNLKYIVVDLDAQRRYRKQMAVAEFFKLKD